MGSVDSWVGYWARLRPARAAVAANARAVTWKALNERSGRLATGLAAEGALGGSRIGVRSRDPVLVIEVIAACARLGTGMDEPLLLLDGAVLTHGNVEAVAVAVMAADGLVPPDCVGITLSATAKPTGIAAALGALHAGALTRFGDIDGLLGDEDRPRPTLLVTTCAELERPGVIERVDAAGLRLVKVPGPAPGALRRKWGARATPFVEMLGLSLQGSPYLESDELVPLLGVEDLALVGRQA